MAADATGLQKREKQDVLTEIIGQPLGVSSKYRMCLDTHQALVLYECVNTSMEGPYNSRRVLHFTHMLQVYFRHRVVGL